MAFGGQFLDAPAIQTLLPNGLNPAGVLRSAPAANRPPANYRNCGYLYVASDTGQTWLSIGTAWVAITTAVFGASGANHSSGAVPDPGSAAGATRFLREDASWAIPPTFSPSGAGHAPGYVPDPGVSAGTSRFLREDATWQTLPLPLINQYRLTLTSGTPVTTSDVTAATTLYWTPYKGDRVALFDGNNWGIYTPGQLSIANSNWTLPVDIFAHVSSGTVSLGSSQWSSNTTRAAGGGLSTTNGVLVGPGVSTDRYLGTIFPPSTTTFEDSLLRRFVWNYYNRVPRPMLFQEATSQWTYASSTLRQANADANAKLQFVYGWAEDPVSIEVFCGVAPSGAAAGNVAIGIDSTTASSADAAIECGGGSGTSGLIAPSFAVYNKAPGIGFHYAAWLESCRAGTCTFYGAFGNSQGSIRGTILG